MNNKKTFLLGLAVGAVALAGIALIWSHYRSQGAVGNGVGAIGTLRIEDYIPVILQNDGLYTERQIQTTATSTISGAGAEFRIGNRHYIPVSGSCADRTGALFGFINPFGATSTVEDFKIVGQNGTTSITLQVGTSTASTVAEATTFPKPTIIDLFGVGTSSAFTIEAGYNTAAALGGLATTSGAGTFSRVMLGPTDYIVGRATSTADHQAASGDPTLQGLTNLNNQFSCTYEGLISL